MTGVLDAEGRNVTELREQWRVGALYSWLCDKKLQKVAVQKNLFRAAHLRSMGVRLGKCLHQNGDRAPENYKYLIASNELKVSMLLLLQNSVARHIIGRIAWESELEGARQARADYEHEMNLWRGAVDRWMADDGPKKGLPSPRRPEAPPAARSKREVLRELQEERLALEAWFAEAAAPREIQL